MCIEQTLSDDTIDTIKNQLITADHSNDDLSVTLKGRIHNNTGFILTASNMEKMITYLMNGNLL